MVEQIAVPIINTQGGPRDVGLVAVVNPDGSPLGVSTQLTPRMVRTRNLVTVAGALDAVPIDMQRTGLTIRNDSDTKMYIRTDGEAGDGAGYPLDAGRGYSFEALGLLPGSAVSVWCATAGKRVAVLYATDGSAYA